MSTFTGFSEEDLKRIKSSELGVNSASRIQSKTLNVKRIDRIGPKPKHKSTMFLKQTSDDTMDTAFDKCKLSLKLPSSVNSSDNNEISENEITSTKIKEVDPIYNNRDVGNEVTNNRIKEENVVTCSIEPYLESECDDVTRKSSTNTVSNNVQNHDNYTENELAAHTVKLEELQLKQKLMEEQNKKRKEMLAKALADRTKQTEEEVVKLEKIKKELQILDGQFSQDVSVLRKKIDQACISYADAEKHYLKVEKEFLQAKINLQKEKEKKELLTEHLCALITHNETRKAQKLETLMLELATNRNDRISEINTTPTDDVSIIIDGVDEKTGKMIEFTPDS